jgi:hypothetical protein
MQRLRRLGVAAGLDDGRQAAPLLQGDVRKTRCLHELFWSCGNHLSTHPIGYSETLSFFIYLINT